MKKGPYKGSKHGVHIIAVRYFRVIDATFMNHEDLHSVLIRAIGGVVTALVTALSTLLLNWLAKKKYKYLLGDWKGYYLDGDGAKLLEQDISITYSWFKLRISLTERTEAAYSYKGTITKRGDTLFCTMHGLNQDDMLFMTALLPFNKKGEIPSMNAIVTGIDQRKRPASSKVHISRLTKGIAEVKKEVGARKPASIIIELDTTENLNQADVHPDLKKKRGSFRAK